jgi:hypothetical protein
MPGGQAAPLVFDLMVGTAEEACGHANFKVNGQELFQIAPSSEGPNGGRRTISAQGAMLDASWLFMCQYAGDGVQLGQVLQFTIHSINYRPAAFQNNGFGVIFQQAGEPQILDVYEYPDAPATSYAIPMLEELVDETAEYSEPDLDDEIAELHFMVEQLNELQYHIAEKEESIRRHGEAESEIRMGDCDSLKCVFKALHHKMRCAAHKIYSKFHGGHHHHHHHHGHHGHGKWRHGKGNHTHEHHGHGNHTHGNHTHPHLPGRRPHHIPFCHFPPHHPPHGRPPHRKPHDGPHHGRPDDGPPHHGKPHDGPPHHGRPDDGPHGPPGPPSHHKPSRPDRPERPDRPARPDRPERPDRPQRPAAASHHGRPHPPHGGPEEGDPHHHHHLFKVLHTLKFVTIGILVACLLLALHRRACSPTRRAERRARREERRRRRSFKRARRVHAFRFLRALILGLPLDDETSEEEKRESLLANAEDGLSGTMSDEIAQFRNVAGVVSEIVAADVSHASAPPPRVSSLSALNPHEMAGLLDHGEQLPAYEDDASSDMSSIADGLRYTPGSTEYNPSQSREGSVSDILGPDTKN